MLKRLSCFLTVLFLIFGFALSAFAESASQNLPISYQTVTVSYTGSSVTDELNFPYTINAESYGQQFRFWHLLGYIDYKKDYTYTVDFVYKIALSVDSSILDSYWNYQSFVVNDIVLANSVVIEKNVTNDDNYYYLAFNIIFTSDSTASSSAEFISLLSSPTVGILGYVGSIDSITVKYVYDVDDLVYKEAIRNGIQSVDNKMTTLNNSVDRVNSNIENMPDHEKNYIQEQAENGDFVNEAQDALNPDVSFDEFQGSVEKLLASVAYDGLTEQIVFPAGKWGNYTFWEQAEVDFTQFTSNPWISILLVVVKGVFCFGILYSLIKAIRKFYENTFGNGATSDEF